MATSTEYTDQLRNIYNLLEANIKSNEKKIEAQDKVFTDLHEIFIQHANKLAAISKSIHQEVLQAVNQEELVVQYYQMLSNSLLRLAECSKKVGHRMKSQVLDPLKNFNKSYQTASERIRKQVQAKIILLNLQESETIRCRQSYNQACEKFEKHKQLKKKVVQKSEFENSKGQLEKFNLVTKMLAQNIASSQKIYLSAVQKNNLQFEVLKKQYGIVSQSISYNQDTRHSFFKKIIISSIKTFQQFASSYQADNFGKLQQLSKKKTTRFEDREFKRLRLLLEKAMRNDFKQRFISYQELKKKKIYKEDISHLNQYFSKLKEKQKKLVQALIQSWFTQQNSKKIDMMHRDAYQQTIRVKTLHVITTNVRQRQKSRHTERQIQQNDLCKQKILFNLSYSLYFIEILFGKVVQMTSFYCKLSQGNFDYLLNAFTVITKHMENNSQIGIEFTFKMMIISERIMLKKTQINKRLTQQVELLCHRYGKMVTKFRDPKFLFKLLTYMYKRKTIWKKINPDTKDNFSIAKGFLAIFSRAKAPVLSQEQQYECLEEMVRIVANFSIPEEIILPFIKQILGNQHESSYQYLKNIILSKKDVKERHSLMYRRQIKTKKEELLKKSVQTRKIAEYAIRIVCQSGFLDRESINLRVVCTALKDIHLQILGRLLIPAQQKWIRLIPFNKNLNFYAIKQQITEKSIPQATEQLITLDVNRSLHMHCEILNPNTLQSLLRIYAYFNKDVLYCQGMNYLAGYIFLKTKSEQNTYRIFQYLMGTRFKEVFLQQFEVLKIKMYQFQRLLTIFHPEISEHFKRQQISPDCYMVSWIITLFTSAYQYTLQSYLIDLLWERFIIWGWPQFFRFVLWIFSLYKEQLLELNFDKALNFLGELGRSELFLSGQKMFKQYFLPTYGDPRNGMDSYPVSEQLLKKFAYQYQLDL